MVAIDTRHGCPSGGGVAKGRVPVQKKASSACCGATLAEGGTPETGFTCTACGKSTTRVLSDPVAHWTCHCGQKRSQVITTPTEG
jgi:hypothetical protein